MSKDSKGFKHGRNNASGQFVSKEKAQASPAKHSVEVVPKAGNGDTGRYGKGK